MPCHYCRRNSYLVSILSALTVGMLVGMVIIAPLTGRSKETVERTAAAAKPADLANLPVPELEQLATDVLAKLNDKSKLLSPAATDTSESPDANLDSLHIRMGMKNARRLLSLAKRLTLESLHERVKNPSLSKEAKLIASVKKVLLDPTLSDSAEVRSGDLTKIWVGPDYAAYLTSDDEAVLLLTHELTHVAARAGRLSAYIDGVNSTARTDLNDDQKEELACDFTAAEVLKRFIASHPTSEPNSLRFSLAFGYETPAKRLTRAWADFCASYRGDSRDDTHLSQDQTIRSLIMIDQDLKSLVPDDALTTRFCH
jgi:hypothetical protein